MFVVPPLGGAAYMMQINFNDLETEVPMKKRHEEKSERKIGLPVLKTGVKAGGWWESAKTWAKKNMKPVT